jgi:hypothetical protein
MHVIGRTTIFSIDTPVLFSFGKFTVSPLPWIPDPTYFLSSRQRTSNAAASGAAAQTQRRAVMFAYPTCLSRKGGWFSSEQKPDRKGARSCTAGWGACIDLPVGVPDFGGGSRCDARAAAAEPPPPRATAAIAARHRVRRSCAKKSVLWTNITACRGGQCAYEGKEVFRHQEVMIDDKGLRLDMRQGGQEWHHVLSSARRASLQAQVRPVPGSAFIAARAARRTPATAIGAGCTCSGRRVRPLSLLPDV